MIEKKITYEVKRNGFNSWTLWKNIEEHYEDHGGISFSPVFRGTKKECLEEKRRLEKNDRTNKRIRKGNSETSRRNL